MMAMSRSAVAARPKEAVPESESWNSSTGIHDVAKALRVGLCDTLIVVDPPPLNPFLVTDRPSLDPDSDAFDSALFFESLAQCRYQEFNRHPSKAFGVTFRDLSVYGYKTSTDYQHTFGNYPATMFRKAFSHGKKQINILNSFDGLVHQGEMLIVLGRPGSGCSTLLKTIAGEMHGLYTGGKSEISYNGKFKREPTLERPS